MTASSTCDEAGRTPHGDQRSDTEEPPGPTRPELAGFATWVFASVMLVDGEPIAQHHRGTYRKDKLGEKIVEAE